MSGRQISTSAIVGPSVYLPTRKDSLCYNRLKSLASRDLISSQLKIEAIIGVCRGGEEPFQHSPHRSAAPNPNRRADLGRCTRLKADFEGWQTFTAHCYVIPTRHCRLSSAEMDVHRVTFASAFVHVCLGNAPHLWEVDNARQDWEVNARRSLDYITESTQLCLCWL